MSHRTFFDGLKAYVGFTEADAGHLRRLRPLVASQFPAVAENFYDHILTDPEAGEAITGGEAQVQRLKRTLVAWMDSGLAGPHDEAFYERRARIGRVHVEIQLPQRFMLTAMNVIRRDFRHLLDRSIPAGHPQHAPTGDALDRLFDLELAIMLETFREDSLARLRRQERLATLGQVAAGIGHDLRNPLGVISSSLYLLRKRLPPDDARVQRHLDRIQAQVGVSNGIIEDLLEIARDRPLRKEEVSLTDLVAEAREGAGLPPGVTVTTSLEAPALLGDRGLLRQALINLLINAAQATEGRGLVEVASWRAEGAVHLSVTDDGPGFPPGSLHEVFEPLVTTRRQGSGLGLALVRSVARRHGGEALAMNPTGRGARVVLTLPDPEET